MADALQALLGADINVEENVFIKRLNVDFTIKAIDGKTLNRLTEQATFYEGKGSNRKKVVDDEKLRGLIIATACVSPDFNNAKLKERYEASDASDCVQKALLFGEIIKINEKIMEISGLSDDDEEDLDEVKN